MYTKYLIKGNGSTNSYDSLKLGKRVVKDWVRRELQQKVN